MNTRFDEVPRITSPPFERLLRYYVGAHRPVILTDFVDDWPALGRWSPEFLKRNYGSRTVDLYDESFQTSGQHYLRSSGEDDLR